MQVKRIAPLIPFVLLSLLAGCGSSEVEEAAETLLATFLSMLTVIVVAIGCFFVVAIIIGLIAAGTRPARFLLHTAKLKPEEEGLKSAGRLAGSHVAVIVVYDAIWLVVVATVAYLLIPNPRTATTNAQVAIILATKAEAREAKAAEAKQKADDATVQAVEAKTQADVANGLAEAAETAEAQDAAVKAQSAKEKAAEAAAKTEEARALTAEAQLKLAREWKRILKQNPLPENFRNLAAIYQDIGDLDEQSKVYDEALAVDTVLS